MNRIGIPCDLNSNRLNTLTNLIERGQVVFFAGAAASWAPPSNLPLADTVKRETLYAILGRLHLDGWSLADRVRNMPVGLLEDIPLEVMFQFLYNTLGQYVTKALAPFDTKLNGVVHNHNHIVLAHTASSFSNVIITTNWDLLLEQALTSSNRPHRVYCSEDKYPLASCPYTPNGVTVAKIHGSIDDPSSIVVTMEQAGDRLTPRKARFLADVFKNYYVCFVGYGFGDYDIYSTIRSIGESNIRGLFILFRPLSGISNEILYVRGDSRKYDLIQDLDAVPIVSDIQVFFNHLCSELFDSLHKSHSANVQSGSKLSEFSDHLEDWSLAISPYQAHAAIGSLYYHLGLGDLSRRIYQRSLDYDLARTSKERSSLLLGRGYGFAREGKYHSYFRDSIKAYGEARRAGDRYQIAESLFHTGAALRHLGGLLQLPAFILLSIASKMYKGIPGRKAQHGHGSALQACTLIKLAITPRLRLFNNMRRHILEELETSYDLLGGPNGNALRIIAELHSKMGERQLALSLASEAELVCKWHHDHVGLANTLRARARINLHDSQTYDAFECYRQSLRISRKSEDYPGAAKSLCGLAEIFLRLCRPTRSQYLFLLSLGVVSRVGWSEFPPSFLLRCTLGLLLSYLRSQFILIEHET